MTNNAERFLDEVLNDAYTSSTLHGDALVEWENALPQVLVEAVTGRVPTQGQRPFTASLDGDWLLKDCQPKALTPNLMDGNYTESEGLASGWHKPDCDRSGWRRIKVPTTVQSALIALGELPDPFWDDNTYKELIEHGTPPDLLNWFMRRTRIEEREWWFARSFTPAPELRGHRVQLTFDGIDYSGSFYLNGNPLGHHAGMFGGPTYDVTKLLKFDAPNELVVRIDRPRDSWKGILKGSPGYGWHYGHLISMGIWRAVRLETIPEIEITSPFVKTLSISPEQAIIEIQYTVHNRGTETQVIDLGGEIAGKNCDAQTLGFTNKVTAPAGLSRYRTQVRLDRPHVWWPMNYGEQNLYELHLSAAGVQAAPVTFGVRTVEKRPLRGAKPEVDYRWQFVINGVPMFIKGANWCWTDPLLEGDPAKYEHILELARRGGIQMFRAWGGGIVESDAFYQKCDEKGLMVYQEFPFCWGPPDFPNTDAEVADRQITTIIKRLRNHPSLVMWGGGNENVEIKGADEGLLMAGRRCRQLDPSRPFHRTSPWGGSIHMWQVFHLGAPIDKCFVDVPSAFFGEFGIPSMTNWEDCLKYLPESKMTAWPPRTDDGGMLMHMNQFSLGDMVKVMRYGDYGPIRDWKTYIEFSQMAQGDAIGFAGNLQRAGSYDDRGGFWFYKMTDLFPGHSWAIVSYYGTPKLAYYRAKQVCSPQSAFAYYKKFDWAPGETFQATLHVSNDSNKRLEGAKVEVTLYGSDLRQMWQQEYAVPNMRTSQRQALADISVALDPARCQPFLLAVALRRADGRLISDRWHWFNYQAKSEAMKKMEEIPAWGWPNDRAPEAFKAYGEAPEARLLSLPRTKLTARLKRQGGGSWALTVHNRSALPAFNVIIDGFPDGYGNYLDDNSFSLYPGEKRIIPLQLADPKARPSNLVVRSWNADPVRP